MNCSFLSNLTRLGRLLRKDGSRSNMAFKIARSKLTQHQRSDESSNSRCFVSAIPLHEEEAVTHCHPMNCVVLPDLTSVFAPFRNLEIEWRQGKKTLSRDEPTNSRPNSKQPAKARKGLVLSSNGCHLNSSTDNLPSREWIVVGVNQRTDSPLYIFGGELDEPDDRSRLQ